MPIDPQHLDLPMDVIFGVAGALGGLGLAAWQYAGKLLAQIPTPDQVTGWHERDVYLCAAIAAVAGIVIILRWISGTMLTQMNKSNEAIQAGARSNEEVAKSNEAVAEALKKLTESINGIALAAVQRAVDETVSGPPLSVAAGKKRG